MQCGLFDQQTVPPVPVMASAAPVVEEFRVKLRSTQPLAIEMARHKLREGFSRGIIAAPCGFGKSVVACSFIEAAIKRGSKVWFVVDRQILVNDMSRKLLSYDIDHGVLMSGHERWMPSHRVQVVSIQTAEKRGWDTDIDLVIVDEAHANLRKSFLAFIENSPKTKVVGLTATPFHKDIAKVYEYIVNPTSTNRQIEEGNLVPLKIYQCVAADMAGAKKVAGEYSDADVITRGRKIIGDIVSTWYSQTMQHFGKPVKTIVFTADTNHGAEIVEAFAKAGFRFEQISYRDDKEDRDAKIEEMRRPDSDIIGLVSCGVLTRGFDVTDIQIGIMARPLRKAFSEFIQQVGRIQRAHTWADGTKKEFGLLLDHAENVAVFVREMEELFENGVDTLADPADARPTRKEPTKKEKKDIFCPKCNKLWAGRSDTCSCGFKRKRVSTTETVPGQMQEVALNGKKLADNRYDLYRQLCAVTRMKNYASGWAANRFKQITGEWPKWNFEKTPNAERITRETQNKLRSLQISYAHGKKKGGDQPGLPT